MTDKTERLSPAEAALEVVQVHRDLADAIEAFAPDRAAAIRTVCDRMESAIRPRLPEWCGLDEVQRHTGWSKSKLRKDARDLEEEGLARRNPYWQIRREAIGDEVPVKKGHERELIDMDDISGTARRLANIDDVA